MARTQASFSQAHLQASAVTSWIVQNARQDENIVEYDEYPGQRRGGHGDEVVGRVGSPAGFVDLEFAPYRPLRSQ